MGYCGAPPMQWSPSIWGDCLFGDATPVGLRLRWAAFASAEAHVLAWRQNWKLTDAMGRAQVHTLRQTQVEAMHTLTGMPATDGSSGGRAASSQQGAGGA